jgi:hypothetical protein
LRVLHHIEIVIRGDAKDLQYLVQHAAMLRRDAGADGKLRRAAAHVE